MEWSFLRRHSCEQNNPKDDICATTDYMTLYKYSGIRGEFWLNDRLLGYHTEYYHTRFPTFPIKLQPLSSRWLDYVQKVAALTGRRRCVDYTEGLRGLRPIWQIKKESEIEFDQTNVNWTSNFELGLLQEQSHLPFSRLWLIKSFQISTQSTYSLFQHSPECKSVPWRKRQHYPRNVEKN